MLAAIDGTPGAPVPCSFMIFRALRQQCRDEVEFARRELELGLDVRLQLDDVRVRFSPDVEIREWVEPASSGREAIVRRTYQTPAGELTAAVKQTEDWPYGDRLPIFDDYVTPRAVECLVADPAHLDRLRYLFVAPSDDDVDVFREHAAGRKQFAAARGLALSGGWKSHRTVPEEEVALIGANGGTGSVVDTLMWLCGGTEPLLWAYDRPQFLAALIELIEEWNRRRVEIHLEAGVDIIVRRAWYEGTDFWSPDLYRRFILPGLKREVELVHQAGARYGYTITTGMLHIAEPLLESGVDVIIGIDPGQGKDTTLADVRTTLGGRAGLWGGVSGPLTVEAGSEADVRQAVEDAFAELAPTGRFILAPVDNVREDAERAWRNVQVFIDTWKSLAGGA
jgi:hypothetical protein